MTTPATETQLLTLLNSLTKTQLGHVKVSRETHSMAHRLLALLVLTGQESTQGPGAPGAGGLVQQLVDQVASLEEAQERIGTQIIEAINNQTQLLLQMAWELGLRPHISDDV